MTPEEKIEALRKLFDNIDGNIEELKQGAWWDGFYWTRQKVRDIIDPPRAKWREDVDERLGWAAELPSPLGSTLRELADLEYGKVDSYADPTTVCLARIVAICEQEVGDGWQADPDEWGDTVTMHDLLGRLACLEYDDHAMRLGKVTDWQGLGHAAAAWLRSLTDGGAA